MLCTLQVQVRLAQKLHMHRTECPARASPQKREAMCAPATPATAAGGPAHALPAAAATRGSARSSAAAASLRFLCAKFSGVLPHCNRGEGRGAARRAPEPPLRAPHPIISQGVQHRDFEEEDDDGGVVIGSRPMQRGPTILQGRGEGGGRRGEGA